MALNPAKVAQAAKIQEAIAALQAKQTALLEHIRTEAKIGTSVIEHKGEQYVVKATAREALDAAAFQKDHPESMYPQFYKHDPVFSATLVKEADRVGYTKPGTTAVSLERIVKDEV